MSLLAHLAGRQGQHHGDDLRLECMLVAQAGRAAVLADEVAREIERTGQLLCAA
jgi:hypothetical protein